MRKEMKRIKSLLSLMLFGLVIIFPTTITVGLFHFWALDSMIPEVAIISMVVQYILMTYFYGHYLARKIDNLFGIKCLTREYQLKEVTDEKRTRTT